jgi:hypothetical protein
MKTSVQTQRNLDEKMSKEILMMKKRKLEELKFEIENDVEILNNMLEVRNI